MAKKTLDEVVAEIGGENVDSVLMEYVLMLIAKAKKLDEVTEILDSGSPTIEAIEEIL